MHNIQLLVFLQDEWSESSPLLYDNKFADKKYYSSTHWFSIVNSDYWLWIRWRQQEYPVSWKVLLDVFDNIEQIPF